MIKIIYINGSSVHKSATMIYLSINKVILKYIYKLQQELKDFSSSYDDANEG